MTGPEALELVLVTTGAVTTAGATSSLIQSWLDRAALVRAGQKWHPAFGGDDAHNPRPLQAPDGTDYFRGGVLVSHVAR